MRVTAEPGTSSRFAPYILFILIKVCLFFTQFYSLPALKLSFCVKASQRSHIQRGVRRGSWEEGLKQWRGVCAQQRDYPALWNFQGCFCAQTVARKRTRGSSAAAYLPSNEFQSRCIFEEVFNTPILSMSTQVVKRIPEELVVQVTRLSA